MARKAIIRTEVDEGALRALGRVVVEFNLLEASLSIALQLAVADNPDIGATVAAEMSTRARTDTLFSLLRGAQQTPELQMQLDKLRVAIGNAEDLRNQYLHSVWASGGHNGGVMSTKFDAKAKHGLRIRRNEMDEAKINQTADEFHSLAEQLITFIASSGLKLPR